MAAVSGTTRRVRDSVPPGTLRATPRDALGGSERYYDTLTHTRTHTHTHQVTKAINETCMRLHYGEAFASIKEFAPCFSACPKPWDLMGNCFIDCFAKASSSYGSRNRTFSMKVWNDAFASENVSEGGCPSLPPVEPSPRFCHKN